MNIGISKIQIGDMHRRILRSSVKPYIELPYIVSKGNSWADTGLYLDPTIHRVQGSFIVDDLSMVSKDNIYPLEGARTNASSGVKASTTIRKLSASTYEIRRDWGRLLLGDYDEVVYEVGKEYQFDFTPEYTQIGELRIDRVPETTGICGNTYYIGYQNDTFDLWANKYYPPGVRATKRIFSIWSSGETIGDIDPVMVKADGTYNMYDKISDSILENKGTEPFTKGETDPLLVLHGGGFLKLHGGGFLKLKK